MAKQRVTQLRGYPDRRGMGAQSDFIGEQFVPSEQYKAQQMAMAQKRIAAGMNPEQLKAIFFIPVDQVIDQVSGEKPESDKPEDL